MAEVLLIDNTWIKKYTPLTGAVDEKLVQVNILKAQDLRVSEYLGDNLMRKIKTDVAAGTISGQYLTLLNDYIRKTLTWWTCYYLMEDLYIRWDNASPQIRIAETTQVATRDDVAIQKNGAKDVAEDYGQKLIDYICANSSDFPEYNQNTAPDRPPQTTNAFSSSSFAISSGRNGGRQFPKWAYDE